MSDGPHRSLPMRRWWRKVAERADKPAFSVSECAEAIAVAMERECREGLRPRFREGLQGLHSEPGLFGTAESPQLRSLALEAETPLERCVMDNIAILTPEDWKDFNRISKAVSNAMRDGTPRFLSQIEEHTLRAAPRRAQHVRERLNEAVQAANLEEVTRRVLQPSTRTAPANVKPKTGLEEGVTLR